VLGPNIGMYCLEVGKGAATAIIEPISNRKPVAYQATIVDVGDKGVRLAQWLQANGVDRIPAILLTHNDADHIGALATLVQAYKGKIGRLRFVVDRRRTPPFWFPAQKWVQYGWVQDLDIMGTPYFARPGTGELLVGPVDGVGFRLYCSYPPRMWGIGLWAKFEMAWTFFFGGANQLSAVLKLTPPNASTPTLSLFGGDLDYKGWQYLVDSKHDLQTQVLLVPHHGGPQRRTQAFGATHLAGATQPTLALISVGTYNNDYHPHGDLVTAMRAAGATVLCTQITPQCLLVAPGAVLNEALLPRLPKLFRLSSVGTACAGTILVQFLVGGATVRRIASHQQAVDQLHLQLQANNRRVLCRQ